MNKISVSTIIKGLNGKVTSSKIGDTIHLGPDLGIIHKSVEEELSLECKDKNDVKRNTARICGKFDEWVIKTSSFVKTKWWTDKYGVTTSYEWFPSCYAKPINDILSIHAGTKQGAGIDLCFEQKEKKTVYACSCRMNAKTHSDLDLRSLQICESKYLEQFKQHDIKYIGFVPNKATFKNHSSEFSEITLYDMNDIRIMWQQLYDKLKSFGFKTRVINEYANGSRVDIYLRYHQKIATKKAIEYYRSGGTRFMFAHICRSGKTITALNTCNELKKLLNKKHINILLLTNYPSINDIEWAATILKYSEFKSFNIIDCSKSSSLIDNFSDDEDNFVMISLQDLKSKSGINGDDGFLTIGDYGIEKAKFDKIRNKFFDLIIIDECDSAVETEKTREILKKIKHQYELSLTATPFKNYANGSFECSNTHTWSELDEKKWASKYPYYAAYPKMEYMVYSPDKSLFQEYAREYTEEEGFKFSKFLRVVNNKFFYEQDAINIVSWIFGKKGKTKCNIRKGPRNQLREMGISMYGILIFVNECKQAKLLTKIVKNIVGDDFVVDYTYADKYKGGDRSGQLMNFVKKISLYDKPFIIIAVDQLSRGITMENVDTCILMNDDASVATFFQKSMRTRNPKEGKTTANVIDLNSGRVFDMLFGLTQNEAYGKGLEHIELWKEYLSCINIYENGKKLEYTNEKLNKLFVHCCQNRNNYFSKRSLILKIDKESETDILKLTYGDAIEDDVISDKMCIYDNNVQNGKTFKILHPDDSKNIKKYEIDYTKQLINILKSIPWALILTEYKYNTFEQVLRELGNISDLKHKYKIDGLKEFSRLIFHGRVFDIDDIELLIKVFRKCIDIVELDSMIQQYIVDSKSNPNIMTEAVEGIHKKVELAQYKHLKSKFGEVFTPIIIIKNLLDKFPSDAWSNPNNKWGDLACGTGNFLLEIKDRLMEGLKNVFLDPSEREKHIIEKMLYGFDKQGKNCLLTNLRININKVAEKVNIECVDSLEYNFGDLRLNYIAMNPPFNSDSGNKGKGNILWDKFVSLANKLLVTNGYLAFIHPSLWRMPDHPMYNQIAVKNSIKYLEMHDEKDGNKLFGSSTRFDCYVSCRNEDGGKTTILTQDKDIIDFDLKCLPFIPNCEFELIKDMVANNPTDAIKILHSESKYECRRPWISNEKTDIFRYPVVYSINKDDVPTFKWSKINSNGHFGVPKVIYAGGATGFLIDHKGEYGMTQWASGIVADPKEFDMIVKVLKSERFKKLVSSISVSKAEINTKILRLFSKNLWSTLYEE